MGGPIKAVAIILPELLDAPRIRTLMRRCYVGFESDADEVCEFLKREIQAPDEWLKLFVAWSEEAGFCGMSLVTVSVDPLSPYPWIQHFVAERPEAREPLVEASIGYIRSRGFDRLFIFNLTGRSDDAHIRLFRRHGKGGTARGSMILYELGN